MVEVAQRKQNCVNREHPTSGDGGETEKKSRTVSEED